MYSFEEIMGFHPDNINVYNEIKRDLPMLIPFVGAGLSQFAYHSWSEALNEISKKITNRENKREVKNLIKQGGEHYLKAAQRLEEFRKPNNFARDIAILFSLEKLNNKKDQLPKEAIWLLPLLFPRLVITTNFDQTLEILYHNNYHIYKVFEPDKLTMLNQYLNHASDYPGIFKLHGTVSGDYIDYDHIVFTEEQYKKFYNDGTELTKALKKCVTQKAILFLGCSLSQDRTLDILESVLEEGKNYYTIINCKKSQRDQKIGELGDKHIRAIVYEGNRHEAVRVILEHLLCETNPDAYKTLDYHNDDVLKLHESDNISTYGNEQFTITSLIEISNDVCNCAKEYGRLIPISQTEAKDHIKLPTLEIDSTVSENNNCLTLMELIENLKESSNIMITGEGGCGKTYALLHCASQIVDKYTSEKSSMERGPIPIYISLNSQLHNEVGIEDYLVKKLAEKLHMDYKDTEIQYIKLLEDIVLQGGYILWLCDGFNEVVSKEMQSRIVHEIKRLQHNKAYRFIITSRYNLSQTFSDISGSLDVCGFKSYKMNPLLDEEALNHVEKFLHKNGKTENEIRLIKSQMMTNKNKVKSIYKKPMGLVMFCGIHTGKVFSANSEDFFTQINTLGELIHNFIFCLRHAYKTNYTRKFHSFLCYLGYRMNIDGVFSITESTLCTYCKDYVALSRDNGITVDSIKDNRYVADVIKFEHDNGIPRISFNHQNYRDYFAASYLKEIIVSFDFSRINFEIGIDKKIPLEVLTILAEILCEYKCIEESNSSVIQKLLSNADANILSPFAVALLIQIAVMGRGGDLTKFKFTNIDLSLTHLNKVNLSKRIDGRPFCAQFDNCIIADETFMPVGHSGAPLAIINIKSRYIVTCSKGGICVFDMKKGFSWIATTYGDSAIISIRHIPILNRFVTGDIDGVLTMWEYSDESDILKIHKTNEFNISKTAEEQADDRKTNICDIQEIVLYRGEIIFTLKNGDVFLADFNFQKIRLYISLYKYLQKFNRFCRAIVIENDVYISYGTFVFKNDAELYDLSSCVEDGYIYDIAAVSVDDCHGLVVNLRGKYFSAVYLIDFHANRVSELKRLPHSSESQGFTGWNKFSPAFNGESSLYLTANINDALDDAGLYLFTFESVYDDDEEEYTGLKCIENGCEIYGNKHIMSIERALHFNYHETDYVATTGVDTNVEIMSEGTDYNLIYHLSGYTKGITSMCIVDETTIYTSHYSGEVCRWNKVSCDNIWKCKVISNPHSDKWVWIVKNFCQNGQNYIVAGSYDHNISITDAKSGKFTILSGCKGHVKTFDFIGNSIIAAYDYNQNGENKYELALFKDINFASGEYKSIKSINAPGMIRGVYCFDNYVYIIINRNNQSNIYQITNSYFNNGSCKHAFDNSVFHTVTGTTKSKVNIRAFDAILLKSGKKIYACGGDIGSFYADVWSEDQKITFDNIPAENPITTNRIGINGISALKLVEFDDKVYMFAVSYNGGIYTYEISVLKNTIKACFISLCTHGDQALDVQYLPETKEIFVSLLSGEVISYDIEKLIRKGQYTFSNDSSLLFKAMPGLHIVGVDLSNNQNNMSKDFNAIVKYYAK